MKLSELAKIVGGEVVSGGNVDIVRVAKIEEAGPGDITFIANPKYRKYLATTSASAVLVSKNEQFKELEQRTSSLHLVGVDNPYHSFLRLVDTFYPAAPPLQPGIHASAVVATTATLGSNVAVSAHVVIGEHCTIRNNVSIHPGCVIGDNVEIGESSLLYANITIREGCRIGKRVIIHSGTVIGSDGFGFAPGGDDTYEKIPQRGIVVVEDDVEIGANCAIDRATIGETRIKHGVKLDNLIQVAHNVVIGENTVVAAQTGISGSTKLGTNCIIAGQVGFVGHITIADRTTIGAQSGVSKSITEPGNMYFGYPAKERHRSLRMESALRGLPEMLVELRQLKERIEKLERHLNELTSNVK